MDVDKYRQVRELFHDLCEKPDEERSRILQELEVDPEIREELESLLDAEPDEGVFGEEQLGRLGNEVRTAAEASSPTSSILTNSAADPLNGPSPESIGPYRVLHKIGESATGVVFAAKKGRLGPVVAVKVIRPGKVEREWVRQLAREAEVVRSMRHPGIASVHEWGEARVNFVDESSTLPFVCMEFIEGVSLQRHFDQANLDRDARMELVARICDAVEHAGEQGILHLNIKPSNILVKRGNDAVGQPVLLGLGIPLIDETPSNEDLVFQSPEVIRGLTRETRAPSDVYSLGVLLFQVLTGRPPFAIRGRHPSEAKRIVLDKRAIRLGAIEPELRGEVEVIVSKSLEKAPYHRYQTSGAMAIDLRRHLTGRVIEAEPWTWRRRVAEFAGHNSTIAFSVVAAFAILVVALAVLGLLLHRASNDEAQARERLAEFESRALHAQERAHEHGRLAYRASLEAAALAQRHGDLRMARQWLDRAPEIYRGWEWDHLLASTEGAKHRLESLSVSSDALLQLRFGNETTAVLLTVDEKKSTARVGRWAIGHSQVEWRDVEGVQKATLDPKGERLYVIREDKSLWIDAWPYEEFRHIADGIQDVFPTLDATALLLTDQDRLEFLDEKDKRSRFPLGKKVSLSEVPFAVSSGGSRVAWSRDGGVYVRETSRGGSLRALPRKEGAPTMLSLSPGGDFLLCVRENSVAVDVYELSGESSRIVARVLDGHEGDLTAMAISHRNLAATADSQGTLRLWDLKDGTLKRTLGETSGLFELAFSADGRYIVGYAQDREGEAALRVWETDPEEDLVLRHYEAVRAIAFSANGQRLYSGDASGTVRFFDTSTGAEVARYAPPTRSDVLDLLVDPEDGYLAVAERLVAAHPVGHRVRILDLLTGEMRLQWPKQAPSRYEVFMALSEDGEFLALHCADEGLAILKTRSMEFAKLSPLGLSEKGSGPIAFESSGRRVILPGREGEVLRVRGDDGAVLDRYSGIGNLATLAVDATRDEFVFGTNKGFSLLRDGAVEKLTMCGADRAASSCLTFSPDGKRLAVGGEESDVVLRDRETFEEVIRLSGHRSTVVDVAFSPDGSLLATASADQTVRLWGTTTKRERESARREDLRLRARLRPEVMESLWKKGRREYVESLTSPSLSEREREVSLQLAVEQSLQ